jgi:hypothetical protein
MAPELADLERTLSMGASKPRSMNPESKPPDPQLHCPSPKTYRRKHNFSKSSRATDRQATLQVLRDLKASGWRRAEGYPHVLALGDGFEVRVAS